MEKIQFKKTKWSLDDADAPRILSMSIRIKDHAYSEHDEDSRGSSSAYKICHSIEDACFHADVISQDLADITFNIRKSFKKINKEVFYDKIDGQIFILDRLQITSGERGNGMGTKLLKETISSITQDMREGDVFVLKAIPMAKNKITGLNQSELIKFYEKHNFVLVNKKQKLMVYKGKTDET